MTKPTAMRTIPLFVTIVVVSVMTACSCRQEPASIQVNTTEVIIDSLKLKNYADTIVCDMVVKNPDKEDIWMEECLSRLNRKALIDSIFEDVYSGKLSAYDFNTHKLLTKKAIKKLEELPGYSRDIVGKFQFREAWFYDKQQHSFIKKVHSIIFGYETYGDSGFVKGYKPLFKVEF
jgi:hypothetical protein